MPEETAEKRKSSLGFTLFAIVTIGFAVAAIIIFKGGPTPPKTSEPQPAVAQKTENVQKTEKQTKKLPRLLDLGAGKCIPCKMMTPILEDLKKTYEGKLAVDFIDVWENREEAERYGISMIPTQLFFDAEGKELFRHEGFFSKDDILAKCKELGFNLQ